MMRKQRNTVAIAASVLSLAGGGGVAWACTGPGSGGPTGTTTTTTTTGTTPTTTTTTGTTTTSTTATAASIRRSRRHHATRHRARLA